MSRRAGCGKSGPLVASYFSGLLMRKRILRRMIIAGSLLVAGAVAFWFFFPESRIEVLWRFGFVDAAVRAAKRQLESDPRSETARLILARHYWSSDQPQRAVRVLGPLFPTGIPREDVRTHVRALMRADASEAALGVCLYLTNDADASAEDRTLLALAAAASGKEQMALQAAEILRPNDPSLRAVRALIAESNGDVDAALDHWRAFLETARRSQAEWLEARSRRTRLALRAGRYNEALKDANQLLRLHPDDPDVHRWRAQALVALGKTDEAAADLKEALKKFPDSWELRGDLAEILAPGPHDELLAVLREGRKRATSESWGAVTRQASQLVQQHPDVTALQAHLALCCFVSGRDDEALAAAEKLMQSENPDAPVAHVVTASILRDRGNHDQALAHWRKGVRSADLLQQRYPELDLLFLRVSYADTALNVGYMNEVHEQCDAVLQIKPNESSARRLKAAAFELQGHSDKALTVLMGVPESAPDYDEVSTKIATLLVGMGKSQQAADFLENQLQQDSSSGPLRQMLARAVLRKYDRAEEYSTSGPMR